MTARHVKIVIDGHEHVVDASTNVLQAALGAGLNLPYFCWHPALGSVGACRQCAVTQYKDENDTQGRLVMSCMTPCADGARFSIADPAAREMRSSVVEYLMTNHPHDCPVCEEGGHCHLQDMTVMTGHVYRRYRHTKRTHRNQDLGPFIGHEMNRCIACYRCVRFYKDYAGGKDLDVFGIGADVYFGRAADGTLESGFSGNLVEVCPTGVFTDKPYGESYTRKWDLQSAPSICAHCSIGCNISPGERYGRLKRIENRYHGEINGYFLCDRGRFGYGFVNRDDRPREALFKVNGEFRPAPDTAAVDHVAKVIQGGRVIGIGSPRASLEANFALRELVGADNFFSGQTALEGELTALGVEILRSAPQIASIRDAERADAVLVLGEDVLNTGARLALAIRQATRQAGIRLAGQAHVPQWQDAAVRTLAQDLRSPLFVATPGTTDLDEIAAACWRADPTGIAQLGMAVAHHIDHNAPAPAGLEAAAGPLARDIAQALIRAERPLIVSGTGCGSAAVLQAAANVATALAHAGRNRPSISLVFAEANSVGASLLGGHPLERALRQMALGDVSTALIVENDLARRVGAGTAEDALARVPNRIVLDAIRTPTLEHATAVLPAGSFAESDGTLVNNEGRAQRYFQVFVPKDEDVFESWRWLQRVAAALNRLELGVTLDDLTAACAKAIPALAEIVRAAPTGKFRMAGARIPRQPHRYSGRTAMTANRDVHEPRPPQDPDSPLAYTMEGTSPLVPKPAALIPMFWAPAWNSPQAVNKFQQEIGGALRGGDAGVRLIRPDVAHRSEYFAPPNTTDAELRAVPVHMLFGSDELSRHAPVMASRIPEAHVVVGPATAAGAQLSDGAFAELGFDGTSAHLKVHVRDGFAENCVGVPAGLPGVPVIAPGAAVTLVPKVRRGAHD